MIVLHKNCIVSKNQCFNGIYHINFSFKLRCDPIYVNSSSILPWRTPKACMGVLGGHLNTPTSFQALPLTCLQGLNFVGLDYFTSINLTSNSTNQLVHVFLTIAWTHFSPLHVFCNSWFFCNSYGFWPKSHNIALPHSPVTCATFQNLQWF